MLHFGLFRSLVKGKWDNEKKFSTTVVWSKLSHRHHSNSYWLFFAINKRLLFKTTVDFHQEDILRKRDQRNFGSPPKNVSIESCEIFMSCHKMSMSFLKCFITYTDQRFLNNKSNFFYHFLNANIASPSRFYIPT